VLDQTCAPRRLARALVAEELERWPGWQPGLSLPPDPNPLAEREEEEWALADRIIAGSQFVLDGIKRAGGPIRKVIVVPYGVDADRFAPDRRPRGNGRRPLRVLFAGAVNLWKGVPYLLEALRQLGPDEVEARFAGSVALAPDKLAPYREVATFLGPVPRLQMPALYGWADVLVLPSLSEGSATVVYEALAAGVYVIATPNAGSVLSGASAFGEIVPIRSAAAIADALRRRREAGRDAQRHPGSPPRVSLEDYRARLLHAARGLA
jgi:glycosyltransferase involved in cell wall biosynthesis